MRKAFSRTKKVLSGMRKVFFLIEKMVLPFEQRPFATPERLFSMQKGL
jgi:hypothetical protein